MKLDLVDDAKKAWKWFSVQAMAASAAIQAVWVGLPDDIKSHFPEKVVAALSIGLLVFGVGGRLVKQTKPNDPAS